MTFEIPEEIIKAYQENRLAIFVGAGLSVNYDIPLWNTLSSKLLEKCYSNNFINESIFDYYKNISDNKKKISFVKYIFKKNNQIDEFYNLLNCYLEGNPEKIQSNKNNNYKKLYQFLLNEKFGFHGLFLTTNADTCLDYFIEDKSSIINKPDDLSETFKVTILYPFRKEKLIHLHGSIKENDSLIFTVEDYLKQYNDDKYIALLQIIFKNFTVLFMGYGLNEFELIDYLINKSNLKKNHYIVVGYPEINDLKEFEEEAYYKKLNLNIIPYTIELKDKDYEEVSLKIYENNNKVSSNIKYKENHNELNELITFLLKNKKQMEYPFDSENNISTIIEDCNNEPYKLDIKDFQDVIEKIFSNKEETKFFISQLIRKEIPSVWFNYLYNQNYLLFNDKINNSELIYFLYMASSTKLINSDDKRRKYFLEIVDNLIDEYDNINFKKDDNSYIFDMMSNIPYSSFSHLHADFTLKVLNNSVLDLIYSTIPKMIKKLIKKDLNKDLNKFIKFILEYKIDGIYIEPRINEYNLNDILSEVSSEISNYNLDNIIQIITNIIEDINKNLYGFYDVYAVEDRENNIRKGFKLIIVHFLRDLLMCTNNYNKLNEYITKFYNSSNIILNRIAFYVINKKYDMLKHILWDSDKNPLDVESSHEISCLLDKHGNNLTNNEINRLITWIEKIKPFYKKGIDKSNLESIKLGWYSYLDKNNPLVNNKINEFDKNYKPYTYLEVFDERLQPVLPTYADDLKDKSNKEIVEFIKNNSNLYTSEVEKSFEAILNVDRIKYINDFIELPVNYQKIIFYKISDNEFFNKINHEKVVAYIIKAFTYSDYNEYYYAMLYYIEFLITKSENNNINIESLLFSKLYKVLKNKSYYNNQNNFDFYNDLLSRLYQIMIEYSLYYEKDKDIKKIIELLEEDPKEELYYFVGSYLYEVNSDVLIENINLIFPKEYEFYSCILLGLTRNYNNVDKQRYDILNRYGIFDKLFDKYREQYTQTFILFILHSYLHLKEKKLMNKLLDVITEEEAINIINSINRENIKPDNYELFIELWEKLVENSEDKKNVLSNLNLWITIIKKLDDKTYNLLSKSIVELKREDCYTILDSYEELVTDSPEFVGKLILKQKVVCFSYDELKNILKIIIEKNKELADKIAKKYKEEGCIHIKELYDEIKEKKL